MHTRCEEHTIDQQGGGFRFLTCILEVLGSNTYLGPHDVLSSLPQNWGCSRWPLAPGKVKAVSTGQPWNIMEPVCEYQLGGRKQVLPVLVWHPHDDTWSKWLASSSTRTRQNSRSDSRHLGSGPNCATSKGGCGDLARYTKGKKHCSQAWVGHQLLLRGGFCDRVPRSRPTCSHTEEKKRCRIYSLQQLLFNLFYHVVFSAQFFKLRCLREAVGWGVPNKCNGISQLLGPCKCC